MSAQLVLTKIVADAVLLYGLTFLLGSRVRFQGLTPALMGALFLVPVAVFIQPITALVGLPQRLPYMFALATGLIAAILYGLTFAVNGFRMDNFRTALVFSALFAAVAIFLNMLVAEHYHILF